MRITERKESPIIGLSGMGGGPTSYILYSASGGATGYEISRSLRFDAQDSNTPTSHLSGDLSSVTFTSYTKGTVSCWVKRTTLGYGVLAAGWDGGVSYSGSIQFNNTDDTLQVGVGGAGDYLFKTNKRFADVSAWYHIVVHWDRDASDAADKVKVWVNGVAQTTSSTTYENWTSGDAQIFRNNNSNRIGRGDGDRYNNYFNGFLADYHYVDGQALDETSFGEFDDYGIWNPKQYSGTHGNAGFHLKFDNTTSNTTIGYDSAGSNNWTTQGIQVAVGDVSTAGDPTVGSQDIPFSSGYSVDLDGNDALYMTGPGTIRGDFTAEIWCYSGDYSGIQRIFSANEGTNSGEYFNMRAYNGNTEFYFKSGVSASGTTLPTDQWNHIAMTRSGSEISYYLNGSRWATDTSSDSIHITTLCVGIGYGSEYFTGKVSNARFVNGQALYTGASYTVPTATLTTTSQGALAHNVRTLVAHTGTITDNEGTLGDKQDSLIDTPTSTSADSGNNLGNYCTWDPLHNFGGLALTDGNLRGETSSGWRVAVGTHRFKTGKWYYEFRADGIITNFLGGWGDAENVNFTDAVGNTSRTYGYYNTGNTRNSNSNTSFGDTYDEGDIIGCAVDLDARKIWWSKNGVWQASGDPANGTNSQYTLADPVADDFFYTPMVSPYDAGTFVIANFGQQAFTYTPPTGFLSICSENMATPTIRKPSEYVGVATYTGEGSSRSITSYDFSPGLVWIKDMDVAWSHQVFDVVRGRYNTINPDSTTNTESSNTEYLTSFDSNGFSVGNNAVVNNSSNPDDYVAWAWRAGISTSYNNDGGLQSTISVNQTAGFSIAKYSYVGTGVDTIGHGLGSAPDVVIRKPLNLGEGWSFYAKEYNGACGFDQRAYLDTDAIWSGTTTFNSLAPTDTVNRINNSNTGVYVDYSFKAIEGYSSFGVYDATSSLPFVYTGFKARWVMIKRATNGVNNWVIYDTERDKDGNPTGERLHPDLQDTNLNNAIHYIDITSNGFKVRSSNGNLLNYYGSSTKYFYMAFAEHPLKYARAH